MTSQTCSGPPEIPARAERFLGDPDGDRVRGFTTRSVCARLTFDTLPSTQNGARPYLSTLISSPPRALQTLSKMLGFHLLPLEFAPLHANQRDLFRCRVSLARVRSLSLFRCQRSLRLYHVRVALSFSEMMKKLASFGHIQCARCHPTSTTIASENNGQKFHQLDSVTTTTTPNLESASMMKCGPEFGNELHLSPRATTKVPVCKANLQESPPTARQFVWGSSV